MDQVIADLKSCKKLLNGFINYYQSRSTEKFSQVNEDFEGYKLKDQQLTTSN